MVKKAAMVAAVILFAYLVNAQQPVSWSFSVKETATKKFEIHLSAKLDKGWYLYSQTTPMNGPLPTTVKFDKNPVISLDKDQLIEEGKMLQKFEPSFGVEVKYFRDTVDFVQYVKLKATTKTLVSGKIYYMACNNQMCLPPQTQTFKVRLP